jgi:hypothetical protein
VAKAAAKGNGAGRSRTAAAKRAQITAQGRRKTTREARTTH